MWVRDTDGDLVNVDTGSNINVEPTTGEFWVRVYGPGTIDDCAQFTLYAGTEADCRGAMNRLAYRLAALDLAQPAPPGVHPPAPETATEAADEPRSC